MSELRHRTAGEAILVIAARAVFSVGFIVVGVVSVAVGLIGGVVFSSGIASIAAAFEVVLSGFAINPAPIRMGGEL